jgi:hypothetical protein
MKKIGICCFIGVALVSGMFGACSNKKEPADKKGAIEKFTDKTARDIVDKIHAPIDKARSAAKQGDDRIKEMDEVLKK